MDIWRVYADKGIQTAPPGHHHYRDGWVSIECPFCVGNPGYHLGWNVEKEFFTCWRCGHHSKPEVFRKLFGIDWKILLQRYITRKTTSVEAKIKPRISGFKLPPHLDFIPLPHRNYLRSRGFDPKQLEQDWGILATGNKAPFAGVDYRGRILVPIVWQGHPVSFLGRDITAHHPMRYLVCPESRELLNIKSTLYGKSEYWGDFGICVEGVTDVWRMGFESFAVYGIKYTPEQRILIVKNFKRVPVLFDDDPQAIKQAKKLVSELRFHGLESFYTTIKGDPASLSDSDAKILIKELKEYKPKNMLFMAAPGGIGVDTHQL